MVDIVRLDHFIGYSKYYRIPIKEKTAHSGEWVKASGDKLFEVLDASMKSFNIIAEDLGDVTEDVVNLRDKYNFSGMRVLQFEFNKIGPLESFSKNSVVCTGTHDNDTIIGWFDSLPESSSNEDVITKSKLLDLFKCDKGNIHWKIISCAFSTASHMVIIPIQDLLGENSYARFNTPGILSDDNWSWRIRRGILTESIKNKLNRLTKNRKNNFINNDLFTEKLEL